MDKVDVSQSNDQIEVSACDLVLEVCMNHRGDGRPSCLVAGAKALYKSLKAWPERPFAVKAGTCLGACHRGPVIRARQAHRPEVYLGEASLASVQDFLAKSAERGPSVD